MHTKYHILVNLWATKLIFGSFWSWKQALFNEHNIAPQSMTQIGVWDDFSQDSLFWILMMQPRSSEFWRPWIQVMTILTILEATLGEPVEVMVFICLSLDFWEHFITAWKVARHRTHPGQDCPDQLFFALSYSLGRQNFDDLWGKTWT